jgi:fructokinase
MNSTRPILFGEVLFDHFPDGTRILGGAPLNVAWHLQAFGLSPLFISRVGDDETGTQVLETMRTAGMDLSGVQIDREHSTGTVRVTLDGGQPSYDIVADQAFDHIDAGAMPCVDEGTILGHGTLARRSAPSRAALDQLLRSGAARRLVDVNLRAPWWRRDEVHDLLRRVDMIKLNDEELGRLTEPGGSLEAGARELRDRSRAKRIVVTRGERGVLAIDEEGASFEAAPKGVTPIVDCVGAGDAFTAVLILGDHREWKFRVTIQHALDFAEAMVGRRGATAEDRGFYSPFLKRWEST